MNKKAVIATGTAIAVLFGLGTWQVQRLTWKNALQASIDDAYKDGAQTGFLSDEDLDTVTSSHLVRGKLSGRLLLDNEIVVGPKRDDAGRNAYDVITPMRLENGEIILVNRGRLFTENFTDPKPDTGESGSIKAVVTGLVQTSPQSAFSFAAKNDPDKNVWLTANADDIAAHEGLENVRPLLMQAEKSSVAKDHLEMRDATPPTLRNEHLQYAIFWYGMGIVLLIIALIRFRKKSA